MPVKSLIKVASGLVLAIAAGALLWIHGHSEGANNGFANANGRLEVKRIDLAAKYPGKVTRITIQEGDEVKAGELIAEQDNADLLAQMEAAESARQRAIEAGARATAESQARSAQARLAQLELGHAKQLLADALVSSAEVERRQAQRDGETSAVDAAKAAVREAAAARQEAEAQIKRLGVALADMKINAPIQGRIEYRIVEPGSVVPSGGRIATLLDLHNVYMTIFLPVAQAGAIKLGDEARIVLDTQDRLVLPARIAFVSSDAQFTPKYVETRSERDKLMYRVKLQVPPDMAAKYRSVLKGGVTGNGVVRLSSQTPWPKELDVHLPPQ